MSSKVVAVKFFDSGHGPGSDIILHLSEEDAENVSMLDESDTPIELPSLPGQFYLSDGSIGNFFKREGTGGRSYSGDFSEIISSIEDPNSTLES